MDVFQVGLTRFCPRAALRTREPTVERWQATYHDTKHRPEADQFWPAPVCAASQTSIMAVAYDGGVVIGADSRTSTGAVYWEGLCELWDSEQRLAGRGYLEMTGYAAPLVL